MRDAAVEHLCPAVEGVGGGEVDFWVFGVMEDLVSEGVHVAMNSVLGPRVRNNVSCGEDPTG